VYVCFDQFNSVCIVRFDSQIWQLRLISNLINFVLYFLSNWLLENNYKLIHGNNSKLIPGNYGCLHCIFDNHVSLGTTKKITSNSALGAIRFDKSALLILRQGYISPSDVFLLKTGHKTVLWPRVHTIYKLCDGLVCFARCVTLVHMRDKFSDS
jgi:hypothetical protein